MQGPFFATVKTDGPFELKSATVNATELYQKDLRHQRFIQIRNRFLIGLLMALPFIFIILVKRTRNRWPFVTVVLYGALFVLVIMPFLWGVFVWLGNGDAGISEWSDLPEIYGWLYGQTSAWPLWLTFAVMLLAQVCLLIIPVRTAHERPKPRRAIWLTALAAAFLYTILLFGVIVSIISAVYGDGWPDCTNGLLWSLLPLNWVLWTVVFGLFARRKDPIGYIHRIVKWLIRGSILELLIAVPSHIIVRHKNVCCAHLGTAAGIAAGLAVMFFAFGPGLYYLYRERIKNKKPIPGRDAQQKGETQQE